jgi:hypothetical protein
LARTTQTAGSPEDIIWPFLLRSMIATLADLICKMMRIVTRTASTHLANKAGYN